MNLKDLEGEVVVYSRLYSVTCLEWLSKSKRNLSQVSWCPSRDMNPVPPECNPKALLRTILLCSLQLDVMFSTEHQLSKYY
jgi:hypothetical protein